eukprot:GFYU01016581.1.p1 GENE.GFYU01016581.1~~GFYU01016581.1.p1  ORF type:complete len:100 (-),score=18.54 GFYU01016581.1:154-417(-)
MVLTVGNNNIDGVKDLILTHAGRELRMPPSLDALLHSLTTPPANTEETTNCVHFAMAFVYTIGGRDAFGRYLCQKITEVLEDEADDE